MNRVTAQSFIENCKLTAVAARVRLLDQTPPDEFVHSFNTGTEYRRLFWHAHAVFVGLPADIQANTYFCSFLLFADGAKLFKNRTDGCEVVAATLAEFTPSERASPNDPSILPLCLARQSQLEELTMSFFFAQLNHEDTGFRGLCRGKWIFNAYLRKAIFVICVFNCLLADSPARCACGGLKCPSVWSERGCFLCDVKATERLRQLFGQDPITRPDPDEYERLVQGVPAQGEPQSYSQLMLAKRLDINFKSAMHEIPFVRVIRQLRLEVLHNEYQGTVVRHFDRLARVLQDRIPHFWKRLNDRLSMFRFADTRLTFPKLISIEGWCRFLSGHQKLHFVLASDVVLLPLIRGLSPLQPHWRCWLLQVRYIRILSKRYLAHSKLGLLHSLITECVRQCVELYSDDMLTSKAHHSTHWDLEIVDAGMPKYNATWVFEQLIFTIKKWLSNSNRISVCATLFERVWISRLLTLVTPSSSPTRPKELYPRRLQFSSLLPHVRAAIRRRYPTLVFDDSDDCQVMTIATLRVNNLLLRSGDFVSSSQVYLRLEVFVRLSENSDPVAIVHTYSLAEPHSDLPHLRSLVSDGEEPACIPADMLDTKCEVCQMSAGGPLLLVNVYD